MSSQLRTDRRLSAGSLVSLSGPETGSASGLGPGAYSVPYTGLIRDETVPNSSSDSAVGPGPGAVRVSGPSDHHSTPSVVYDTVSERHDSFVDPPSAETPLVSAYLVTELPLVEATLVVSSRSSVRKRFLDARRLLFARRKKNALRPPGSDPSRGEPGDLSQHLPAEGAALPGAYPVDTDENLDSEILRAAPVEPSPAARLRRLMQRLVRHNVQYSASQDILEADVQVIQRRIDGMEESGPSVGGENGSNIEADVGGVSNQNLSVHHDLSPPDTRDNREIRNEVSSVNGTTHALSGSRHDISMGHDTSVPNESAPGKTDKGQPDPCHFVDHSCNMGAYGRAFDKERLRIGHVVDQATTNAASVSSGDAVRVSAASTCNSDDRGTDDNHESNEGGAPNGQDAEGGSYNQDTDENQDAEDSCKKGAYGRGFDKKRLGIGHVVDQATTNAASASSGDAVRVSAASTCNSDDRGTDDNRESNEGGAPNGHDTEGGRYHRDTDENQDAEDGYDNGGGHGNDDGNNNDDDTNEDGNEKKDSDDGDDGNKSDDDEDETEEGVDEDEDDDDTEDEENDDDNDDSEDAMDCDSNDGSVFEITDSSDDDDDDNEFRPERLQGRIDPASHDDDHRIGGPFRLQEADVDGWEQKRKHKVLTESACETLVLKSREKMKRDSGVRNQDERSTNDTSFPIDRTRYIHGVQRPGRSFFQRRSFLKFYKERQECAVALVVVQNTKTNECGACSGFVVHKRRGLTVAAAHLLSGHVDETTNRLYEDCKLLLAIPDEKDSDELIHFYAAELVACDFKTDVCILRNLAGSPFSTSVRELKLTEKKCRLQDPVRLFGFSQDGEGLFDPKSFLNCRLGVLFGNVSMLGKYGGATPIGPTNYVPHEEIKVSGTPAVPGHSGGPCINDSGEVVGILCRVDKDYRTVWYIIPCSQIRTLLDEAEARGCPQVEACESPPVARSRRESFLGLLRFGGHSYKSNVEA
jgi:Trypsin-like peptidase domain